MFRGSQEQLRHDVCHTMTLRDYCLTMGDERVCLLSKSFRYEAGSWFCLLDVWTNYVCSEVAQHVLSTLFGLLCPKNIILCFLSLCEWKTIFMSGVCVWMVGTCIWKYAIWNCWHDSFALLRGHVIRTRLLLNRFVPEFVLHLSRDSMSDFAECVSERRRFVEQLCFSSTRLSLLWIWNGRS